MTDETLDPELQLKLIMPDRPWEHEQDMKEWVDASTGYLCTIWRHPTLGHLCGYVGVPKGHRCSGLGYNDMIDIEVYGGLTYSEEDAVRGVHVFGFDAHHGGDLAPKLAVTLLKYVGNERVRMGTYRTWEFVEEQVLSLCKQLKLKE